MTLNDVVNQARLLTPDEIFTAIDLRSPSWRFHEAYTLAEEHAGVQRLRLPRYVDPAVEEFTVYMHSFIKILKGMPHPNITETDAGQTALSECRKARDRLNAQHPEIGDAAMLFYSLSTERRFGLEAVMLAEGCTEDFMVSAWAYPRMLIRTYQLLFFDTWCPRTNLTKMLELAPVAARLGPDYTNIDQGWKSIAIQFGHPGLQGLWFQAGHSEGTKDVFRRIQEDNGLVKSALAVAALRPMAFNAAEQLSAIVGMHAQNRAPSNMTQRQDQIAALLLASIKFSAVTLKLNEPAALAPEEEHIAIQRILKDTRTADGGRQAPDTRALVAAPSSEQLADERQRRSAHVKKVGAKLRSRKKRTSKNK